METTSNLGLKKPAANEFYSIDDFNYNADKIDEEVNAVKLVKHTHSNKTVLDGITADKVIDWDDNTVFISSFNNDGRYISLSEIADGIDSKTEANIKKNPSATDGDIIDTHLTVGYRTGDVGINSVVTGGYNDNPNKASGDVSAVIGGHSNTASSYCSAVLGGNSNTGSGDYSAVIGGNSNTASGYNSAVLGGNSNTASGDYSVVIGGNSNTALASQLKTGNYSKAGTAGYSSGTAGDAFIIGNGTSTAQSNCFRVAYDGYVYGGKTFAANSADYAEFFEWEDGNPNNEDRRGLFVTLGNNEKIKLANENDDIIGVVSAQPCLVGDAYSDNWQGMYLKDVFGVPLKQTVHYEAEYRDGEIVHEAYDSEEYVLNPDYDPEQEYVPREERPEWSPIGLVGKLIVVDDGTCVAGGYCMPKDAGIATNVEYGYKVLSRIDDTHIKILI